MNIEKYTERVRGFIQSAQSLAVREGHQQFSPLHILKVLLDDSEGLAGGLIDRSGGNSRAILQATEAELSKMPKVSGGGAGQIYLAPATARAFEAAEQAAVEMLIRLADEYGARVHVVHLAAASAIESLRDARRRGVPITVETCPHYLTFCAEEIPDGATLFKCAPPIREASVRARLWDALTDGAIDLVATDQ